MPVRRGESEKEQHRKFAAGCFNSVWKLLDKKRRTREEDDAMIHAAHASRFHWGEVGTAQNLSIGEWQISRVYAVLGRAEPALYHANQCLEICRENGLSDFPLAYAYEALARASAVAGKKREVTKYLALGRKAGEAIKEKEDRELFFSDLKTVPGYRAD